MKDELPRSVGAQYATGDQWRNNSRKNEEEKPKEKQHPVVDMIDDGSKVQCCKEQYCIGTWNVRCMNQANWKWSTDGKNTNILRISELKWAGIGNLIQKTIMSTTEGKNPLEEME